MLSYLLWRQESTDAGTFGLLSLGDRVYCTGELPWRDNRRGESCIPSGRYECRWTYSPRFGRHTYEVLDVPGRDGIRFHAANFFGDREKGMRCEVDGCIALGARVGAIGGQRALIASATALQSFELELAGSPFELVISTQVQIQS